MLGTKRACAREFSLGFDGAVWGPLGDWLYDNDRRSLWALARTCKPLHDMFGLPFWIHRIPNAAKDHPMRATLIPDRMVVAFSISAQTWWCAFCQKRNVYISPHPMEPRLCYNCERSHPETNLVSRTFGCKEMHKRAEDIEKLPSKSRYGSAGQCWYNAYLEAEVAALPDKPESAIARNRRLRGEQLPRIVSECGMGVEARFPGPFSTTCQAFVSGALKEWKLRVVLIALCRMAELICEFETRLALLYKDYDVPAAVTMIVTQIWYHRDDYGVNDMSKFADDMAFSLICMLGRTETFVAALSARHIPDYGLYLNDVAVRYYILGLDRTRSVDSVVDSLTQIKSAHGDRSREDRARNLANLGLLIAPNDPIREEYMSGRCTLSDVRRRLIPLQILRPNS